MTTTRRLLRLLSSNAVHYVAAIALSISTALAGLAIPLAIKELIDSLLLGGNFRLLSSTVVIVIVLAVFETIGTWGRRRVLTPPSRKLESRMRAKLVSALLGTESAYLSRKSSGQLLTVLVADLAIVRRFAAYSLPFVIINTSMVGAGLVVLLLISLPVGILVTIGVACLGLIGRGYYKRYEDASSRSRAAAARLTSVYSHLIDNAVPINALGDTRAVSLPIRDAASSLRAVERRKAVLESRYSPTNTLIFSVLIVTSLAVASLGVLTGSMTVGDLAAIVGVITFMRPAIDSLGALATDMAATGAANSRYWKLLDEANSNERRHVTFTYGTSSHGPDSKGLNEHGGEVILDVSELLIGEKPRTERTRTVSFRIHEQEVVHLIASDLQEAEEIAQYLLGLSDAEAGQIRVSSRLRGTSPGQQASIAAALPDAELFEGTIAQNVSLAREEGFTGSSIDRALWAAGLDDLIANRQSGAEANIGISGVRISGGEGQRMAIARALYQSPRLLVLCGATTALDKPIEKLIFARIRSAYPRTALLVIDNLQGCSVASARVEDLRGPSALGV